MPVPLTARELNHPPSTPIIIIFVRTKGTSLTFPSEDNNFTRKNFLHRMLFGDIYYVFVLCYCISFHHFIVYVENFKSSVPLFCMYVDVMVCFCQTYIKKLLTSVTLS